MALQLARRRARAFDVLLWYLRVLSAFFFVSGLYHWAVILGITTDFTALPVHWQAAHVYFAILDLAAALGLWFGAAWGVAAWLFCAVAELVMHNLFGELFGTALGMTVFHAATILAYVAIAWWAGTPENTGDVLRLPEE